MMIVAGGDASCGGEDTAAAVHPKKRAETWGQDEIRALISHRRVTDNQFNTSKSNKHLWETISAGMRERGFDRSPTMCTDKWRNLLKEFKKARVLGKVMTCHEEIEEILRQRGNKGSTGGVSKVDSFLNLSDKGIEDRSIPFGPIEASGRQTLNLERRLDHDGHPLAITAADTVTGNGVSPWNWRDTPENGEQLNSYNGRVITVQWGDYTKRIGIDATTEAIKEAIKSTFGLRTKRAFWLEDEENIVRALDRDMPLGAYTLHLDEGLTIKVCLFEEPDHLPVHTEDKTFYTENDFRDFISRRGWACLREFNGYRNIDSMDDLCPGAVYRGVN